MSGEEFFTHLQAIINARDYQNLSPFFEQYELTLGGTTALPEWPYNLHILGFLINNDLDNARFLWKRIPKHISDANPELQAFWRLTQAMWTRDSPTMYTCLHSNQWSVACSGAVAFLTETIRKRTMALLSKAYTTVSVADSANFLGLTEELTLKFVELAGWQLDVASKMLTVKNAEEEQQATTGYKQLQQLTEYVVHLEG